MSTHTSTPIRQFQPSADGLWLASQLANGPVYYQSILDAAATRGFTKERFEAALGEIGARRHGNLYQLEESSLPYWRSKTAGPAAAAQPTAKPAPESPPSVVVSVGGDRAGLDSTDDIYERRRRAAGRPAVVDLMPHLGPKYHERTDSDAPAAAQVERSA